MSLAEEVAQMHERQHMALLSYVMNQCQCLSQAMLRTGADLLAAIAEEVQTHVARPQKSAAAEALIGQADDVLAAIGAVLSVALAAPSGSFVS